MLEGKTIRISTDTIIRTVLVIAGTIILFRIKDILILVLVAIVIASFVESGVLFFSRYKIKRSLSVPLIFLVAISIILSVFYAFLPIVFRELSGVISLISSYLPSSNSLDPQSIKGATTLVTNLTNNTSFKDILSNIKTVTTNMSDGVTAVIGSAFGSVIDSILVLVMSFYLSIQEKGIYTFLKIITPGKNEQYVLGLWARVQQKIGLWFKGQLFLGIVVGSLVFIVMALMGVQYSFLIGIISGIAEIIPFGLIFAAIPAILFAVIQGGAMLAFKVLIFFVVLRETEGYVLSPLVMRRVVGIPPLVVLLSFLIGITLAGIWGVILAIPAAVFILEYISDIEKKKSLVTIKDQEIEL